MSQICPKRWIKNILYKQLNNTFKAFYITRNCNKSVLRKENSTVMSVFGNYLNFWFLTSMMSRKISWHLMALNKKVNNIIQKIKWVFQAIKIFKFCKNCILSRRNSLMISFSCQFLNIWPLWNHKFLKNGIGARRIL